MHFQMGGICSFSKPPYFMLKAGGFDDLSEPAKLVLYEPLQPLQTRAQLIDVWRRRWLCCR